MSFLSLFRGKSASLTKDNPGLKRILAGISWDARVTDGECWLLNLHISPFEKSTHFSPDPTRKRKLLLHKHEIRRLRAKTEEQGMTIVPLEIFINEKGLCKVTIALVKGKKTYDKRESLQRKDLERDRDREG